MFRKASIALSLGAALLLSSCAGLNPTSVGTITSAFIKEVDAVVLTICKAVPEVTAIVSLVNAGIGLSVGGVATAFCQSFATAVPAPAPAARRFGRRFGGSTSSYMCAGSICGWRVQ